MVIIIPAQSRPQTGPRPIDLNHDVPQILSLLELVFGRSVVSVRSRMSGSHVEQVRQPAFMWRLSPGVGKLGLGYVWENDGRIVGNATVLKTSSYLRYLVVNVAVHPDFRRQGIARMLMEAVADMVSARQGREISLQVEKDNEAALNLYRSLEYDEVGSITSWRMASSRLREIPATHTGQREPDIRGLRPQEWRAAFDLDVDAQRPDLNWPEGLSVDAYRTGLWRSFIRLLNGVRSETWVVAGDNGGLFGLASLRSEWLQPHDLKIRVHPSRRGQLERPLLAKAVRRIRYLPRRDVRVDHIDDDASMNELLSEANFQPRRTLTHMQLSL